jgi:hypothetical protein
MAEQTLESPLAARKREVERAEGSPVSESKPTEFTPPSEAEPPEGAPAPEAKPTEAVPGSKEANLAAMREKMKTLEAQLAEAAPYSQKYNELKEQHDRLSPVQKILEDRFSGDPEALASHLETTSKKLTEFDSALQEKDLAIQMTQLRSSDWYQENVARPLEATKAQVVGIVGGDAALATKIANLSPFGANGEPTPVQPMEIKAMSDALKDAGVEVNPAWVAQAVNEWKSKASAASQIESDRAGQLAKIKAEQEQAELRRHTEMMETQKTLISTMARESANNLIGTVNKELPALFDSGELKVASEGARKYLEDAAFSDSGSMNWGSAAEMVTKANLFDKLMGSGDLQKIIDERAREREAGGGDLVPGEGVGKTMQTVSERKAASLAGV